MGRSAVDSSYSLQRDAFLLAGYWTAQRINPEPISWSLFRFGLATGFPRHCLIWHLFDKPCQTVHLTRLEGVLSWIAQAIGPNLGIFVR